MSDAGNRNERQIGRVVSVSNFRVTVLLDPDIRSQVRSYPRQITLVTQIGGYILFPVAPGEFAVGVVVGAYENEAVEPDIEAGMTLQLAGARRTLRLNLVGQLVERQPFIPGISVYPALDTPAILPDDEQIHQILRYTPQIEKKEEDIALEVGVSPIYARESVTASFNDLLGRPLGIVGNTGSGKSYSVASLIQETLRNKNNAAKLAKIIILDINGEYSHAFTSLCPSPSPGTRSLNKVHVNGKPFQLPLWVFNLAEFIAFFEAAQASQVPVLERVVSFVREREADPKTSKPLREVVRLSDHCRDCLGSLATYAAEINGSAVCDNAAEVVECLKQYGDALVKCAKDRIDIPESIQKLDTMLASFKEKGLLDRKAYREMRKQKNYDGFNRMEPALANTVEAIVDQLEPMFEEVRNDAMAKGGLKEITADSPIPFDSRELDRDAIYRVAVARFRGQERIQEYIATLRLRVHRQLSDKRWAVFTDQNGISLPSLLETICGAADEQIIIVDCSMLANDVLPFFCAVFGRLILELRERALPEKKAMQPYVLVLEEAHNYLKPKTQEESFGVRLSREAFERIAKEGRKFGLSLVIASQRPSDISATVLSQCANFLVHRIQNPEDIDYFKKILPTGSRDMLDQLPILATGDGLLLGSAVNVPARVKIKKPDPTPSSETPKPWKAWQNGEPKFDISGTAESWCDGKPRTDGQPKKDGSS